MTVNNITSMVNPINGNCISQHMKYNEWDGYFVQNLIEFLWKFLLHNRELRPYLMTEMSEWINDA